MPAEVVIPKMGMTMSEGTLVEWLVDDGVEVQAGQPIFVLSTEKVDAEIEAEVSGILHHAVAPNTTLPTGGIVGWLNQPEEAAPTLVPAAVNESTNAAEAEPPASPTLAAATMSANGNGRLLASPNARRVARERGVDLTALRGTGPGGRIVANDVELAKTHEPVPEAPTTPAAPPRSASFPARQLAAKLGVDLNTVRPSGGNGTISRQDVEATAAARLRSHPSPPLAMPAERIPLAGMRGTIARRMHASLHEMAQLTLGTDVSADAIVRLRDELKDAWAIDGKAVPTYTDLIARAAAIALRAHPLLNARIVDDAIEVLPDIHIGIAIALDGGLVVPAVRHADRIDLAQFAADSSELVERARANRLTMHDLEGATFSVTALGSYGIDFFTPVINPPNVAILGVGRIRDTVVWAGERQNEPRRAQLITLSLTFDHRAVDGAPAAAFLGTVGELLERPMRLL